MGVNHLRKHAAIATSGAANGNIGGSPNPVQTSSGSQFKRPAETSGTRNVPKVGAVETFSNEGLHPGHAPAQPPKGNANGGRAGAKSSQEKIGTRKGTSRPASGTSLN